MYKSSALLVATAACFTVLATPAAASLIGPAADYNAFIFGNYTLTNSSVAGSVAAGGNATLGGFSVNTNGGNASTALVVGGNLNASNGSISGSVSYGGSQSLSGATVSGTQTHGVPVDFEGARALYASYSMALSALPPTGSALSQYGGLTLTGTSSTLNIFNLSGAALTSTNVFNLVVPQGSTALINVDGTSDALANFGFSMGTSSQNVLFNFYQATTLSASGVGIQGSVLAPLASFTFANGQLDGILIASSFSGGAGSTGALHNIPFQGTLPNVTASPASRPVPEPSSTMLLGLGLFALALGRRFRPGLLRILAPMLARSRERLQVAGLRSA